MNIRKFGPDLREILLDEIENIEVQVRRTENKCLIEIQGKQCYLTYANINRSGNWYFGFDPKFIEETTKIDFAVFLCSNRRLGVSCFILPFQRFQNFAKRGEPVNKPGEKYDYQSHILPKKTYPMVMTGCPSSELIMKDFLKIKGEIDEKLALHFMDFIDVPKNQQN